tara:strand:+ start:3685 stop:3921 length:237 start_codon:yes stop_codon:yes gene_type:complete
MSFSKNSDKLAQNINDFAAHVEQYSKTGEDKLIMASAMLAIVKAIYLEQSLTLEIAESVFEKQLEDVFQLNLVKPTLH